MATVMTLTNKPDVGAVLIEVTGAPAGALTIVRVDDNGTGTVRLAENQVPLGGSLTIFDYECALNGVVNYSLTGDRTNSLPNPSFETDTSGWLIVAGQATITRDTTTFVSGVASGRLDTIAGSTNAYVSSGTTSVAATPENVWTGSASVKGTGSAQVAILATDGTNTLATYVSDTFALTGTYQRISVTSAKLPIGTTNVRLRVYQTTTSVAQQLWFDAALLEQTGTLNGYIEGTVSSSTITETITTSIVQPFITAAILPHFRQAVTAVIDYSATQDTSSTVHWVVDREDPLVISGPQRFRTGGVDMYADDYAKARALAEVATSGEVMMLRQPDYLGMDMYLVPLSVTVRPYITETLPRRWQVSVDYVEVKAPDGPVRSGTWNFDEIKAIGSFNAIKALFPTFNDLVAGP